MMTKSTNINIQDFVNVNNRLLALMSEAVANMAKTSSIDEEEIALSEDTRRRCIQALSNSNFRAEVWQEVDVHTRTAARVYALGLALIRKLPNQSNKSVADFESSQMYTALIELRGTTIRYLRNTSQERNLIQRIVDLLKTCANFFIRLVSANNNPSFFQTTAYSLEQFAKYQQLAVDVYQQLSEAEQDLRINYNNNNNMFSTGYGDEESPKEEPILDMDSSMLISKR